MSGWIGFLSGAVVALAGVFLTHAWTRRREHEGRLWARRADAYVSLMQWRLSPPDEVAIANPHQLADAREHWIESGMPVIAALSVFGGDFVQSVVREEPNLFRAARALSEIPTGQLSQSAYTELTHLESPGRSWFPHRRTLDRRGVGGLGAATDD